MEDAVVFYPSPAIGHLISMVQLGKLMLTHQPSLSINILITTLPYNAGSTTSYINHTSTTTPSITFHHLPPPSLHPDNSSSRHHETLALEVLRNNNSNIRQVLKSISKNYTIHALIMDFFCTPAMVIAAEFDIPGYYFITCGAAFLASFLYFPTIHQKTTKSLKHLNTKLDFPGLPLIPSADMPKPILERTDKAYEYFLEAAGHMPKAAGIIVNTFELLEKRAINAISDGLCVPDAPTPPLFCIGPLIAEPDDQVGGGNGSVAECLTWLDSQPSRSVVFLCFGSLGLFSSQQLKEIANGLDRSGERFLWVVRSQPPPEDHNKRFFALSDPDLHSLLPEGFLDRTKERGLVVKQWAPQVAVLNHDSVGGFVTHCGWNSVLEAISAGVPMVAWPLYAEQRFNRIVLVEEMKLVLSMEESEDGSVSAAEVEKRVRELMDPAKGKWVRERTMATKENARAAMSEGGSARVALTKWVESWKQRVSNMKNS